MEILRPKTPRSTTEMGEGQMIRIALAFGFGVVAMAYFGSYFVAGFTAFWSAFAP